MKYDTVSGKVTKIESGQRSTITDTDQIYRQVGFNYKFCKCTNRATEVSEEEDEDEE